MLPMLPIIPISSVTVHFSSSPGPGEPGSGLRRRAGYRGRKQLDGGLRSGAHMVFMEVYYPRRRRGSAASAARKGTSTGRTSVKAGDAEDHVRPPWLTCSIVLEIVLVRALLENS